MNRIVTWVFCAGVFGALCWDSSRRLADEYPHIGLCFREHPKHVGKKVWVNANPVVESNAYDFVVQSYETRVRVRSAMRPAVGSYVMVYGTFRSDLSIDAIQCREESHYPLKRKGVYAVSLIALVLGFLLFRRTFAWRDGAFHPV